MADNPCYECPERAFGCHGRCKRYIEWAEARQRQNELLRAERLKERYLNEEPFRAVERSRKGKKRG